MAKGEGRKGRQEQKRAREGDDDECDQTTLYTSLKMSVDSIIMYN